MATKKIMLLQRGNVLVGDVSNFGALGQYRRMDNAAVVRKWGTTDGLGQLAFHGPQSDTILDKCPPVTFHELTVIFEMDCNPDAWA